MRQYTMYKCTIKQTHKINNARTQALTRVITGNPVDKLSIVVVH